MKKNNINKKGISLIEILVVITVFSVLGILASRAILLTIRGTKKSDSLIKVRGNLDYSMAIIERQLRNASQVSPCPNIDTLTLNYLDNEGIAASFSCHDIATEGYVASGSARLTSDEIKVTSCSFACTPSLSAGLPPSVSITFIGEDVSTSGVESARVTITSKILLRTY
jgi:prepilin-type N-terminal cleavage/methylation domain-containing protein